MVLPWALTCLDFFAVVGVENQNLTMHSRAWWTFGNPHGCVWATQFEHTWFSLLIFCHSFLFGWSVSCWVEYCLIYCIISDETNSLVENAHIFAKRHSKVLGALSSKPGVSRGTMSQSLEIYSDMADEASAFLIWVWLSVRLNRCDRVTWCLGPFSLVSTFNSHSCPFLSK
jgi:hypothetical protein